jgi:phosphoenolpyruvate synthase/pyruvate phosphate dikinase
MEQLWTKGIGASNGAAVGHLVFNKSDATAYASTGKPYILCKLDTTVDDVESLKVQKRMPAVN